jgi:hypothetical protein
VLSRYCCDAPAEHAEITEGKRLGKSSLQVKISLELRAWLEDE